MKKNCYVYFFCILTSFNCKNGFNTNGNILEIEYFEEYVKIPKVIITGSLPDCKLYRHWNFWKGVFIEGRTVKLNSYCISKYEVTYKKWKAIYNWATDNGYSFKFAGSKGSDNTNSDLQPVTSISWADCIVWCNAYTEKTMGISNCVYRSSTDDSTVIKKAENVTDENLTIEQMKKNMKKKGFRLPTEAEWEFAARYQGYDSTNAVKSGNFWLTKINSASGANLPPAFEGVIIPSGKSLENLQNETTRIAVYGNYWNGHSYISQIYSVNTTAIVGSKEANKLDIYDMSGNVYEWCFDKLSNSNNVDNNDYLYKIAGIVENPLGCVDGTNRIIRGGSFKFPAQNTAVGYRGFQIPNNPQEHIGFRLVWNY